MQPNKRKLYLQLRKRMRILRRFTVEYLGDSTFRYTCRTCGQAHTDHKTNPAGKPFNEQAMQKLAAYQQQGGGASGVCDHCTKLARDERYPLT